MAGIPSHAAESYLSKLLALGKKVAICDQLEPPKPGKLVKRGITRILTPGTVLEDRQLEASHNHFLLALDLDKKVHGLLGSIYRRENLHSPTKPLRAISFPFFIPFPPEKS